MRSAAPLSAGTRTRLLGGCLGALVLAVLAFGLTIAAIFHYADSKLADTEPPPGDARRFDPIAAYGEVAAFAGENAQLVSIAARFVRSDGTMDLKADYRPSPSAQYRFVREMPAPAEAPPVGAGGNADGRWHESVHVGISRPWQFRSVRRVGGSGGASYQYFNRGMERRTDPPSGRASAAIAPPPACAFRRLWAEAIARGAPAAAVAVIEYDARGYAFRIDDLGFSMRVAADCSVWERL